MLPEESEEVSVPLSSETTERGGRAGPLLQPGSARGEVTRHARQGPSPPMDPSRQRQRQLYQAATRRRHRRGQALYDRSVRPDSRWRAWREVRAQGGSAGVDGVRRADVAPQGVAACRRALAQARRGGPYRPQPVRRVSMPQPDGRHRPRGMPTVRDRVVHHAGTIVLEPRWAAHVQDTSYGCRPKRRATHAGQVVTAHRVSERVGGRRR